MTDIKDQPPPASNGNPPIWELIIAEVSAGADGSEADDLRALVVGDMAMRDALGFRRYGVRLQASNGRDALVDAYQEALDLAAYSKQATQEGHDTQEVYEAAILLVFTIRARILERDGA